MKTPEDEAFDELAQRQGMWGGGFQAKRKAAADKLHWSDCAVHNAPAYPAGECDCGAMNDRQRLEAIVSVINKYLPPDGTPIKDAVSEIISLVDPLPPKREWVGLTDDELADIWYKESLDWMEFARAVLAKSKEKNT
jgi:hypothetical protein